MQPVPYSQVQIPEEIGIDIITNKKTGVLSSREVREITLKCAKMRSTCKKYLKTFDSCWSIFVSKILTLAPEIKPNCIWKECTSRQYRLLNHWIDNTPTFLNLNISGVGRQLVVNEGELEIYGIQKTNTKIKVVCSRPKTFSEHSSEIAPFENTDMAIRRLSNEMPGPLRMTLSEDKLAFSHRSTIFDRLTKKAVFTINGHKKDRMIPKFDEIKPIMIGNRVFILFFNHESQHELRCYNSDNWQEPPISIEIKGGVKSWYSNSNAIILCQPINAYSGFVLNAVSIEGITSIKNAELPKFRCLGTFDTGRPPFLMKMGEEFLICTYSSTKPTEMKKLKQTEEGLQLFDFPLACLKDLKFSRLIESMHYHLDRLFIIDISDYNSRRLVIIDLPSEQAKTFHLKYPGFPSTVAGMVSTELGCLHSLIPHVVEQEDVLSLFTLDYAGSNPIEGKDL